MGDAWDRWPTDAKKDPVAASRGGLNAGEIASSFDMTKPSISIISAS
jgi:hypothetical protein